MKQVTWSLQQRNSIAIDTREYAKGMVSIVIDGKRKPTKVSSIVLPIKEYVTRQLARAESMSNISCMSRYLQATEHYAYDQWYSFVGDNKIVHRSNNPLSDNQIIYSLIDTNKAINAWAEEYGNPEFISLKPKLSSMEEKDALGEELAAAIE